MTLRKVSLCGVAFAALVFGQEFRATIAGHVIDSSGAAVPNASVQATNVATNETSSATTDSTGTYSIPFLRPGGYKLTVTAAGFKQFVRENITLQVNQMAGIDVTLEVGQLTETINVTAEVALLETQTASRGGLVDTRQVAELPLNARNPFMLGAMMSGVSFRGAAIWQRPFDNGAIADWSINGSRTRDGEFLLDGAPNNGQAGGNNVAYVPIVDAVQEFNIQSNTYDAQYGHTGGGIMNIVLKSGTNNFHGSAWEFMRRTPLDANTFQSNAVGGQRAEHYLDQYGGQVEGPLHIPKLLPKDGPIKGFFLGSFENYREGTPNPLTLSFPEPEMRTGDFSKLVNASGQPVIIYDPFNATMDASGNPVRAPFPGNRIPSNRIHPVMQNLMKYMPLPNAQTPGVAYSTSNLRFPEYFAKDKFYNLILKFDFNVGDRHRLFFRHASNDRTEDRNSNGVFSGPGQDGQQPFQRINDAYVVDWVGTLTPTFIANVRASHNRFIEKGWGRGNEGFDLTSLGLPSSVIGQLPGPTFFGRWEWEGYNSLGRYQSINITNNYGINGNLTKIAGSHTFHFGVDLRRIHYIEQNSGNILFLRGERNFTRRTWNQADTTSGDGFATMLLGLISNGSSNYPVYPFYQLWYAAPFVQDDWKVNRRLTLNLGLRWDYNGLASEKYNRLNRGFNGQAASPIAGLIPAEFKTQYPQLANLRGGLEFAGANGNSRVVGDSDWNNFQPRVGAAFQINNKLVMRGGYGLYFLNPGNADLRTTGFSTNTPAVTSPDGGRTPVANLLSNPFPDGIRTPVGSSLGLATFVGQDFAWFNPKYRTPFVHQFSFGFQYQVTQTATLDLSYVGSRSRNLNAEKDFNLPTADFRRQCYPLEGGSVSYCDQQLPNPFRGLAPFAGTSYFSNATISRYNLNRAFPQFTGNLNETGRNDSYMWYNSLQVNLNQRVSKGLNLLANYTLSKQVEEWNYLDPFNNVPQRGLYLADRPHIVKFSVIYELPFGKGQRFGSGAGGFLNKLIGGWQITTFNTIQSGEPSNLPGNAIMLKDPKVAPDWKAYQVRGWSPCVLRMANDGSIAPQPYSVAAGCGTDASNYAWLQVPNYAPRRLNPERSGQIRKNSLISMDSSLSKLTTLGEKMRFQVGFEAFNVLNHNYTGRDSFNTDPNNPNFGTIFPHLVSTQNMLPRQIQVRFKFLW